MKMSAEQIFFRVFEALPRQGPGSSECTLRALSLCHDLNDQPRILDLGCGAGAQTMCLAENAPGTLVAVDAHAPFIDVLRRKALQHGLANRVDAIVGDMAKLELPAKEFDLVWSEGALYNLGLKVALPLCWDLLRPGGWLAFTEAVWRRDEAPAEVRAAFADYPTMGREENVITMLDQGDWREVSSFELPHEAWWENFYTPMEERIRELRVELSSSEQSQAVLADIESEIVMHREFGSYYGYSFFIAKKP